MTAIPKTETIRALILEDNTDFVTSLSRAFRGVMQFTAVQTPEEARSKVSSSVDIAIVDLYLHGKSSGVPEGMDFLRWLAEERPGLPVIVITGHGTTDLVVNAMRLGADDFIDKGRLDPNEIEKRIRDAIERKQLKRQVRDLEQRLDVYESRQLLGNSHAIQEVRRAIQTVAQDGEVTALLRGETGTGKELAARMIHDGGQRRKGPFIPVDASTLPSEMMASELFGVEKGAFTGADAARAGYIETAEGGVLFLDEIGELPKDSQTRLLRVLEERSVTRLGSTRPKAVDLQLVAATNQDLEEMVKLDRFRRDLYYRLKVFEIRLPALRDHPEDIPDLVGSFLHQWRQVGRTTLVRATSETLEVLKSYSWPGNVRELRNCLEAASVRAKVEKRTDLEVDLLSVEVGGTNQVCQAANKTSPASVEYARAEAEIRCVAKALEAAASQKEKARETLGYGDRHTMRRRLLDLRRRFPELWQMYPVLESCYGEESARDGDSRG